MRYICFAQVRIDDDSVMIVNSVMSMIANGYIHIRSTTIVAATAAAITVRVKA
jgi:hypothetical protein